MTALPQKDVRETDEIPGGLHSEARILSVLSQYAGMQIILAASGIVRNKIVAYRLGPAAFGDIAQISNLASTVATLVAFGMGVGISRNTAKARDPAERQAQLANANAIVLTLGALSCATALVLLATGHLLPAVGLPNNPLTIAATAIFLAAVPMDALRNNYLALLTGVLDVKGLATGRSVAVLAATVLAIPVVWLFGFVGAAVQYLMLALFVAALLAWRCHAIGYAPLGVQLRRPIVAQLVSFGIVSMMSAFGQSFADTAIRRSVIELAGSAANGLLQAPYVLAHTVKSVVLMSVGSISLATLSAQSDPEARSASANRLLNVVIPVGASALGLLGLLGSFTLTVLYSRAFTPAAELFPALLCAGQLMVFVRLTAAPLLASGDRVQWVVLELLYSAARWGTSVALLPRYGSMGVAIGDLVATATQALLTFGFFRFKYNLRARMVHFWRLAFGLAFIAALSWVGAHHVRPMVFVGAAVAWCTYTAVYGHSILWPEIRRRLGSVQK